MSTYYNVRDVATAFAFKAKESQKASLTHKKLQKLLYYAQAWNLVFNGDKLFDEPIQAWVHGPVVPSLYHELKKFGYNKFEVSDGTPVPTFRDENQQVIDSVWATYGLNYDADYLEMLTHSELPWINARAGMDEFESCQNEISLTDMREFYGQKIKAQAA